MSLEKFFKKCAVSYAYIVCWPCCFYNEISDNDEGQGKGKDGEREVEMRQMQRGEMLRL